MAWFSIWSPPTASQYLSFQMLAHNPSGICKNSLQLADPAPRYPWYVAQVMPLLVCMGAPYFGSIPHGLGFADALSAGFPVRPPSACLIKAMMSVWLATTNSCSAMGVEEVPLFIVNRPFTCFFHIRIKVQDFECITSSAR